MEEYEIELLKQEVELLRRYQRFSRKIAKFMYFLSNSKSEYIRKKANRHMDTYKDICKQCYNIRQHKKLIEEQL